MQKNNHGTVKVLLQVAVIIAILLYGVLVYANSLGRTEATRKNGTGCDCHGPVATQSVLVTITGPDTLNINQTATYTVTVQGGPTVRGGINIAASGGDLNPVSSTLQKFNGELTHNAPAPFNSGTLSFEFTYTAPSQSGSQMLYAAGNSVNFNRNNTGDQWNFAPDKTIMVRSATTAIEHVEQHPAQTFSLLQNYPNPFNPKTSVEFTVPSFQFVSLKIFNILGKEVATLINQELSAGIYVVGFDASRLPSGIYICTLTGKQYATSKRMLLLK
jgi:hypothetical protein